MKTTIYEELDSETIRSKMCDDGRAAWDKYKNADREEMLYNYKRWIEFCLKYDFPTMDQITLLAGDIARKHGIYVSEKVNEAIKTSGTFVFLGECRGKVVFDGLVSADVYVKGNADIEFVSKNGAYAAVTIYGDADIRIKKDDNSKIYTYGDKK